MEEIMVDDLISSMLNLSGYPDFSVAIKLCKKPETKHSDSYENAQKKTFQHASGNRKGL